MASSLPAPAPVPPGAVEFAPPDLDDVDVAAVVAVLRSGWLTTGEQCVALEAELADYLGVPFVVAVSSGTAAIEIAYAALGLAPGARVGVPTWTFASSAFAPHHHGAVPVLLDVDAATLNLSVDSLEAALHDGLDAVVGVHFGGVALAPAVHDMCAAAGVPLVEDAAHALGATDHRGRVGGQGTAGACFSFYATKNLTSGEGGALATDRPDVAAFARSFRLHGMSRDAWDRYRPGRWAQYDLVAPGIKANLPDLLAALARTQLSRFDAMQARRRQLVERYRARIARLDGVQVVPAGPVAGSADHLLVVRLPADVDRSAVIADLSAASVATSVHFEPLHRFDWFRRHAVVGPSGVPGAEAAADHVLSLPLSSALTVDDVDRVCDVLADALDRAWAFGRGVALVRGAS